MKRNQVIDMIQSLIGNELLQKAAAKDELGNGVQFFGAEEVTKVAFGVSLNAAFLEKAAAWGAELCIFHHGFDPRTYKSAYPLSTQKRLQLIVQNNLTIMGFHYALDAHPDLGNNTQIAKKLGATITDTLFEEWGFVAQFEQPQQLLHLKARCAELFAHDVFACQTGPTEITTIGIVSGAGKPSAEHLAEMHDKGVQLFITGETSESVPHKMMESEINYFACGHYATEVFGVKALAKALKTQLPDLEIQFLDVWSEV